MDCPPPFNITLEILNSKGVVLATEHRTIVYKCGDEMTELIAKIEVDKKKAANEQNR